jgi:hypothetical protein
MSSFSFFQESVCRREGYTITERLLTWAGFLWTPVLLVAPILVFGGIVQIGDQLYNSPAAPSPEYYWYTFAAIASFPVIVLIGIFADRIGGRFIALALMLVLAIVMQAFSFKSELVSIFSRDLVSPAIVGLGFVIAYECVPLRWRLVTILLLSMLPHIGRDAVEFGVARYIIYEDVNALLGYEIDSLMFETSMNSDLLPIEQLGADRKRTAVFIIASVCLALTGVLWLRFRNTLLAQSAERVRALVTSSTSEPIPRTILVPNRAPHLTNREKESAAVSWWKPSPGRVCAIGLVVLMCLGLGNTLELWDAYSLTAINSMFGKQADLWWAYDGILIRTITEVSITAIAIGAWFYHGRTDVRYLAPVGLLLLAVGNIILISYPSADLLDDLLLSNEVEAEDLDEPVETSNMTVSAGYVITGLGIPLVRFVVVQLALDIFSAKNRALGTLAIVSAVHIGEDLYRVAPLIGSALYTGDMFWMAYCIVISLMGFAAFYVTQWYDASLLSRDPELDANWLVAPPQQGEEESDPLIPLTTE